MVLFAKSFNSFGTCKFGFAEFVGVSYNAVL